MAVTDRVHSPTPEELMAFLDGESPADARAGIQAHLDGCAECQAVVADLRGVSTQLNRWSLEDAPVALRPPRMQRSTGWTLRAFSWRPAYLFVSLGAVAATVALVIGASSLTKPRLPSPAGGAPELPVTVQAADGVSEANGAVDGRVDLKRREQSGPENQVRAAGAPPPGTVAESVTVPRQPSVIRTATLRLVASDFNAARASVEAIVTQNGGFLDQITVNGAPGTARTLNGSLRVPAARLGDALARLRQLGQVTEDTQDSQDVTDQLVDLDARLANARATEQRLNEILKNRTGRLSDVLQVEQQISRVRLEIEQMDAQRVNTGRQVTYATIALEINEIRKAGLESGPLSLATRLRVAAADGLESALESVVAAVLFALRAGPSAALWLGAAAGVWFVARRRHTKVRI